MSVIDKGELARDGQVKDWGDDPTSYAVRNANFFSSEQLIAGAPSRERSVFKAACITAVGKRGELPPEVFEKYLDVEHYYARQEVIDHYNLPHGSLNDQLLACALTDKTLEGKRGDRARRWCEHKAVQFIGMADDSEKYNKLKADHERTLAVVWRAYAENNFPYPSPN